MVLLESVALEAQVRRDEPRLLWRVLASRRLQLIGDALQLMVALICTRDALLLDVRVVFGEKLRLRIG